MSGQSNRYLFEDFVIDCEGATSNDGLLGTLYRFMSGYGYDRIIFNDLRAPAFGEPGIQLNNLPPEFWRYYTDNNCASYDPIYLKLRTYQSAFRWNGAEAMPSLSKKQLAFMNDLANLGLRHGVALPLRGRLESVMGVSSSQPLDGCEPPVALLEAAANQFYSSYRQLNTSPHETIEMRPSLSVKEHDVLSWMAIGKTDDEIAAILSITRSTVNAHGRSIFRKLGTHSRVRAVVLGVISGQIQL